MHLRHQGIYRLPNGRELIAFVSPREGTILRHRQRPHKLTYAVNSAGRLLLDGRLTAWDVEQVLDTGLNEDGTHQIVTDFYQPA